MRLFLCGGGSDNKTKQAYLKFSGMIDTNKPLLYIPLAMKAERYDSCLEWITDELKPYGIEEIDMVRSIRELELKCLTDYSAIFIGGGNTFKLLYELKMTSCFEKIDQYIRNDGIVFGGSAGAIIFGESIETCKYADKNEVNLLNCEGFDMLQGVSLLCHYTNQSKEKNEINREYLLTLNRRVYALPEEVTLYVTAGDVEVIGDTEYYIFENGEEKINHI